MRTRSPFIACAAVATLLLSADSYGAATVIVLNANEPGVGFNDPTPLPPAGGNA